MTSSICSAQPISFKNLDKPSLISGNCPNRKVELINNCTTSSRKVNFEALKVKVVVIISIWSSESSVLHHCAKAADNKPTTKVNSILCSDCEGNGAVACTQCKGSGVNSVDHFNGQFKAGALCWLCSGKKKILCGNCNGAGFVGGFLSTKDE